MFLRMNPGNKYKKLVIGITFLLMLLSSVFGQDNVITNHERHALKIKADSLNELCRKTWNNDRKLALTFAEEALAISVKLNYKGSGKMVPDQ